MGDQLIFHKHFIIVTLQYNGYYDLIAKQKNEMFNIL